MTDEEVEASKLRGKMRALPEREFSIKVEVPTSVLAVVTLAERSSDLERQVTKRE